MNTLLKIACDQFDDVLAEEVAKLATDKTAGFWGAIASGLGAGQSNFGLGVGNEYQAPAAAGPGRPKPSAPAAAPAAPAQAPAAAPSPVATTAAAVDPHKPPPFKFQDTPKEESPYMTPAEKKLVSAPPTNVAQPGAKPAAPAAATTAARPAASSAPTDSSDPKSQALAWNS